MKSLLAAGVLLSAASLSACSDTAPPSSSSVAATSPATTATSEAPVSGITGNAPPPTTTTRPIPAIPASLDEVEIDTVNLDGNELMVAIADTPEARRQGLMGVTDLLDLDGMLFVFDEDTASGFWMKDTLIPLDIAFFSVDGAYVDSFVMEPCTTADCPTYFPGGAYRYALEMAAGMMPDDRSELTLGGAWMGDEEG